MRYTIAFLGLVLLLPISLRADHPAYKLFNKQGDSTSFKKLLASAMDADVILFGEQHDNPIDHWLQQSLVKKLSQKGHDSLIIGGEMFQRSDQQLINEYLQGFIKEKHFKRSANLWDNYQTNYKPIMTLAKSNDYPLIATNVPRRYANFVAYHGLEALDTFNKRIYDYMAPMPIPLDMDLLGYQKIQEMGAHGNAEYLAQAQALKDATMAHTINQNWAPGNTFIHLNGSFHSNDFEGIYWYLQKYNPKLKVITIATVEQADVRDLKAEHQGKADFIICTPKDMTATY